MSLNTIKQTIIGEFYNNWNSTDVDTQVRYSNQIFRPPEDSSWASIDIRWIPSENVSISSNSCIRRKGLIVLDLFSPIDAGTSGLDAMADEALALFENKQLVVTADVIGTSIQCFSADIRHIGVPNIQGTDPQWYKFSIRILFYRDE